jgi:hypothetical protein
VCGDNDMQSYFSPISALHSTLYEISSSHSKETDRRHDNGKFKCSVHNASKITQAIKMVPLHAWVPNINGNVNRHTETVLLVDPVAGTLTQTVNISRGFYSTAEYITLLNTAFAGNIEFAVSTTDRDRITIKQIAVGNMGLVASVDWFDMMGFTSYGNTIINDPPFFTSITFNDPLQMVLVNGVTFTGTTPPNFGGDQVVHVEIIRGSLHGNMLSTDNIKRDILLSVSLHDVPYGTYKHAQANDLFVDEYTFPNETDLSELEITLLDKKYRPMDIPLNYDVRLILKVFHNFTFFK